VGFSRVAIDRGRKIADRHGVIMDRVVVDVLDYDPLAPVDLAMIIYLHVHRTDLARLLGKAAAALSPGGTLFVLGWDRQYFADGIGGPGPPEVLYSVDDL
jgi:SAM-dependent methyltransferase